jgi:hypothetical protein
MRIGQCAFAAGRENDSVVTPRCDQQRAGVAQRLALSPCALRAPAQMPIVVAQEAICIQTLVDSYG